MSAMVNFSVFLSYFAVHLFIAPFTCIWLNTHLHAALILIVLMRGI